MRKICGVPWRSETNAILEPSGDTLAERSIEGELVSRACTLPSAAEILYSSALPSKDSVATSEPPPGNHAAPEFSPGRFEMRVARPPPAGTSHRSLPPSRNEVKAIWPPLGE